MERKVVLICQVTGHPGNEATVPPTAAGVLGAAEPWEEVVQETQPPCPVPSGRRCVHQGHTLDRRGFVLLLPSWPLAASGLQYLLRLPSSPHWTSGLGLMVINLRTGDSVAHSNRAPQCAPAVSLRKPVGNGTVLLKAWETVDPNAPFIYPCVSYASCLFSATV